MTIRADKRKNQEKIIKEVIKNPIQSQREIAEKVGLGKTTVQEHLQGIKTVKDDRIVSLTDKDLDCITLGVKEIKRRLTIKEELEKMRTGEISQVIKENTARYTLFRGGATDDQGGLKDASAIDSLNKLIDK